MATIITYAIPACINTLLADYNHEAIVNAVQSELNAGSILKASAKTTCDFAIIKNNDGSKYQAIVFRSKAGEKLACNVTVPVLFASWTKSIETAMSYGTFDFTMPANFATWLNKFAKK